MGILRAILSRLRGSFRKRHADAHLEAELQSHLQMLAEENIRRGMTPEEARYAARREFGGIEQTKEAYRDRRGLPFLDAFRRDMRFALRSFIKKPGFAAAAILTLALGMGSTTAVFSVVDRNLFRSLPYPGDDRLVSFGFLAPVERNEFMLGTPYVQWRGRETPFESMTTMRGVSGCDLTERNPVRLSCARVESTFLSTFGIVPLLGRNFTRDEDRPKAPGVALLSHGLWRARFGGSSDILDKTIELDGQPTRILGILPSNFEMPNLAHADILMPQALDEAAQRPPNTGALLRAFARLKPGVSITQAKAALQPFFQDALGGVPPAFRKEVSLAVRSLRDRQIHDARAASWILLGSVVAVLLVACANVANLLLARAAGRQRELAVCVALGASRGRLARQALTESLLLGLLGGTAGYWTAYLLVRLFMRIAPEGIPRLQQAALDMRVVIFTLGVSLISGLLFGLASALRRTAPELLSGKEKHATARSLLRETLVAAQIATSLVLLATAGLLLRTLWNLQSSPTGMETENVLIEAVALGSHRYPNAAQQSAFFTELEARLRRLPGVESLAMSDSLPPAGQMRSTIFAAIEIAGQPPLAEGTGGMVGWRLVTPEYFSVLAIPIIRGRGFREEDRLPGEETIILSDTLARKLFPKQDPIGKEVRLFRLPGPWRAVVGVAADVKNNGLSAGADPEFYLPWKNSVRLDARDTYSVPAGHVILRSRSSANAVAAWMRAETAALDPVLPITIETLSQRVGKLAARPKFNAVLLSLFAGMGVLLAAIGIYGVVGQLVTQQTREIGVRLALGATPRDILAMIFGSISRWTIAGAALGLLGAWICSRFLRTQLFNVSPHDPFLLGSALLLLSAVAFFAAWLPARRAMRVDPAVTLRYE